MTQMFAKDAAMFAPGTVVPGKGVRAIRCVGCARDTLPRDHDNAPLCPRCCHVLACAAITATEPVEGPRPARWFWRRYDDQ